jgi:hypothetical protein
MLDFEDLKLMGTVFLIFFIFIIVISILISIPIYINNYWECTNLTNLYSGEYELKWIFPNGCLIKARGIWVGYHEFQNYLNLNMVK